MLQRNQFKFLEMIDISSAKKTTFGIGKILLKKTAAKQTVYKCQARKLK